MVGYVEPLVQRTGVFSGHHTRGIQRGLYGCRMFAGGLSLDWAVGTYRLISISCNYIK